MTLEEFNQGFEAFLKVYLRGMPEKESCHELKITRTRYATYVTCLSPEQRLQRRNAIKVRSEARLALVPPPALPSRSELLAHIASLLRCNGVWASMKSYERLSNKELVKVRDRLQRNRSDKYQYS